MLGFFQRMPAPQARHGWVCTGQCSGVLQQAVGEDRGDVLQRGGGRQLPLRRELLLGETNPCLGAALDCADVVAQVA